MVVVHNKEDVLRNFPGTEVIHERENSFVVLGKPSVIPWVIIVPYGDVDTNVESYLFNVGLQIRDVISTHYTDHLHNLAKIGNKNPVYHLHLVMREHGDSAWPQPVWCVEDKIETSHEHVNVIRHMLENEFMKKKVG